MEKTRRRKRIMDIKAKITKGGDFISKATNYIVKI